MRNPENHRVLVSGLGSIGRRHLQNLMSLGVANIALHTTGKGTISDPLPDLESFTDLSHALDKFDPTEVFVCGPSHLHSINTIQSLQSGANVFVEKPLAISNVQLDDIASNLEQRPGSLMVGYMLRFHPILNRVKALIDERAIGTLVHIRSEWGEYLPDWHPWEDYRATYAAQKEMGGGPSLTLSHEIDLARWFLGELTLVGSSSNRSSGLEIDTEHGIDMLLKSDRGATANLHMDYYQRPPARRTEFVGTDGRISFDYYNVRAEVFKSNTSEPVEVLDMSDSFDRNMMFLDEIKYFFNCLQNAESPKPGFEDGKQVALLALQAANS